MNKIEKPKLHKPDEHPVESNEDDEYSVDVITIDSDGLSKIAYFNFIQYKWRFHDDDYYDTGAFGWHYPVYTKYDVV